MICKKFHKLTCSEIFSHVLHIWSVRAIPTYRVYRLYDTIIAVSLQLPDSPNQNCRYHLQESYDHPIFLCYAYHLDYGVYFSKINVNVHCKPGAGCVQCVIMGGEVGLFSCDSPLNGCLLSNQCQLSLHNVCAILVASFGIVFGGGQVTWTSLEIIG